MLLFLLISEKSLFPIRLWGAVSLRVVQLAAAAASYHLQYDGRCTFMRGEYKNLKGHD